MPRRNDLEHKALHLIANTGNQGVLQSEMWRKLDASSREGSRISLKLENKGLIRRTRELFGGRWTYRLYIKRKPASINSIINCPCLMCPEDPRCGVWSTISPTQCKELSKWISDLVQEEMNPLGETQFCRKLGSKSIEETIIIGRQKKKSFDHERLINFSKR